MTMRSERKWAAKDARAAQIREDAKPMPQAGPPHPDSREGKAAQKNAAQTAGEAAAAHEAQMQHKSVGEKHVMMAAGHQAAANALTKTLKKAPADAPDRDVMQKAADMHTAKASAHQTMAKTHAEAAGPEWDGSTYPMDSDT